MWEDLKKAVSEYSPTRGVAFILGLGLLVYGFWLFLPIDPFTNPIYDLMATLATKQVWGYVFLGTGGAMMWGVFKKDLKMLGTGAWLGFVVWTTLTVIGVIAEPTAPISIARATVALLHAWIYVQVKIHPSLVTGEVSIADLNEFIEERNNNN